MNQHTPLIALLGLATAACASASAGPSGDTSEVRKVEGFRGIELAGMIEVEARIDRGAPKVEVIGDPAFARYVFTTVEKGVLVIDTKFPKHTRNAQIRVAVTAPRLDSVSISGTGAMRVSGLEAKTLDARIAGTGALSLAGTTSTLRLDVHGTGEVRAKDLVASTAIVDIAGTAEASVHASARAKIDISGTGAVRVHGRPSTLDKQISGTGVVDLR
ncbi:MAG: GIN domain-containing protein [Kofleriaceae bacterium]